MNARTHLRQQSLNGLNKPYETPHFYIGITLHDLFDSCQGEGRVAIIRRLLFRGVDLSLPKAPQELVQRLPRLDIWLGLRHRQRGSSGRAQGELCAL